MSENINFATGAKSFIDRVTELPKIPGVSLDSALAPSVEDEAELRRLYAQDRKSNRILDPYVGLISVFDAPVDVRTTRARVINNENDLSAKHIFPLDNSKRRKESEPCMVDSLEEFQKNWTIFTEGSLSQLTDWNNVVAAGGSVLGCLLPLSEETKDSKRNIRKFYHSEAYPTSDIDLFIWGLNPEQAEVKINQIYYVVRDSIPWDVTCFRTKHAISIHSQYPYRSIQIVLRLYQSPAEILAGFDVDSACVAYDGSRILANPRSIVAMMRQANAVDIIRRSPSYEIRLAKYASRGFEVYVPDLRREDVDPTIFERSINRIIGLARLLVLEKLSKPQARQSYLESRRRIRSRANIPNKYQARNRRKRSYKNDLKEDCEIGDLEFNDYDLVSLHIPYGPGWTAKRIETLVYQTDLGANSTFNPRNKGRRLHRHPAFFGTMEECIEDICGYCPEPRSEEERDIQDQEDKTFVRGRISFIKNDPGRQSMTGSFNPIDAGEWSEQAYLGPTERFFSSIAALDRNAVKRMIASEQVDVNRRDHVGRTALQVAVFCKASDICIDLIDAGARMTARVVDGRTALHMAAQLGLPEVVEKMILKSAENAARAEGKEASKATNVVVDQKTVDGHGDCVISEDDWTYVDGDSNVKGKETGALRGMNEDTVIPEDNVCDPDILDVNATDWDFAFTPLAYAIIGGSSRIVRMLLNAGANPKLATKANDRQAPIFHPLTIATLSEDEDKSVEIVNELLRAGASSSQANEQLFSHFHALVCSGKTRIVEKILRDDPRASSAINVPAFISDDIPTFVYPLVSAIAMGHYAIAVLLIAYGAKVQIAAEDVQKAKNMVLSDPQAHYNSTNEVPHVLDYLKDTMLPAEAAISRYTYLLKLLVNLRAQVSVPTQTALNFSHLGDTYRQSIHDWVTSQLEALRKEVAKGRPKEQSPKLKVPRSPVSFNDHRRVWAAKIHALQGKTAPKPPQRDVFTERSLSFFEEMEEILKESGAKTYADIYPDRERALKSETNPTKKNKIADGIHRTGYKLLQEQMCWAAPVLAHILDQYDALFEACWAGDNEKIEELCLPRKSAGPDGVPIQIAVITQAQEKGTFAQLEGTHTPLSVAIQARRWETARLVLAISIAQWTPSEESENEFSMKNIDLDEDSFDEDPETGTEDNTVEQKPEKFDSFTDLSTRTSAVKSTAPPSLLMNTRVSGRISKNGKRVLHGTVLTIAAEDGDLEAFVNICELMKLLPTPQLPTKQIINDIMHGDSPEVLDEYIRRSGHGIETEQEKVDEEVIGGSTMEESKFYLGLDVHGKKRKDLAKIGDTYGKADNSEEEIPLLWTAVRCSAKKIIEYLAGAGPLAAYRYYASTASDERALALRKLPLEKLLPSLLGITPNFRNETPLTAILVGMDRGKDKLAHIKGLLSVFPLQGKVYLHSTLRFVHWNPLMLAVMTGCGNTVLEFLIYSGISVEATDERGYNIIHMICRRGSVRTLDYILGKLPHDLFSRLLKQLSREGGNTPLMLAVKSKKFAIVDALFATKLPAVNECMFVRDKNGLLPVHVAVQNGMAKIVSSIITNTGADILYIENAVGETSVEIAAIQWLLHASRGAFNHGLSDIRTSWSWRDPAPFDVKRLLPEVETLKYVQANLEQDGKLNTNPELKRALEVFIPYLARKCEEGKDTSEELRSNVKNTELDLSDPAQTFKIVSSFASASQCVRQLVHITDVHDSVRTSLELAVKPQKPLKGLGRDIRRSRLARRKFEKETELPAEVDKDEGAKEQMWKGILRFHVDLRKSDRL